MLVVLIGLTLGLATVIARVRFRQIVHRREIEPVVLSACSKRERERVGRAEIEQRGGGGRGRRRS